MKIKGNIVTITKLALLGTASLFAFGSAAYAQDQAADAPVETAETTTDAASELEFLKAQVESLQAQINEIQKKSTATEATWKSATWATETKLSGRMYFNFSNIDAKSNGAKSTANGTGINIKRFYFGVDHTFSPIFSANLTMDVSNVVGNTANANFPGAPSNGTCTTLPCTPTITNNVALVGKGFYIKKAYLQAKLSPALIVRVGAADLPWVPYVENQYGYRHIENTLIDRISFGTSADWGIHVLGDLADGLLSYQVSVVNGAGYRNVKVTKSVDVEGRVSAQYKGAYAAVGGYVGKLGNDVQNTSTFHTAKRFNALVGYKNKLFNVGGEYFYAKDYNNNGQNYINSATLADKAEGYSVFANVNFMDKWSAFGRYDHIKPRKDLTSIKDNYFNLGIQYSPVKIVDLALVYKRDKAENGTIGTTNGTIGGTVDGTYDEVGLFGQFRF